MFQNDAHAIEGSPDAVMDAAMSLAKKILRYPVLWAVIGVLLLMTTPVRAALEHYFLYFPTPDLVATPQLYDLPYEDLHFTADDGTALHGWLVAGQPDAPLVLFFMGNAGNMSHRLDNLRFLHRLGVSVCIFDYRGYGKSSGKASEQGLYSDARGLMTALRQRGWEPGRMIFFGRSIGAAVALQIALEAPPAGLVLESPFTSIEAMGKTHNPVLFTLFGWAIDATYDNLGKIDQLKGPVLIFHGEEDTICPPEMARQLYARANEPKQLVWISDAGHNQTFDSGGQLYLEQWTRFVGKVLP